MSPNERPSIRIRDPIHGTIHLMRHETALVDAPAYQRLRMIKQLGLADLAFPGATHTRYAHGLGTMHVASRMFQRISSFYELTPEASGRLSSTVRLAALFHDLGHAPLSHTTEGFMPPVRLLGLGEWQAGDPDRRASHEDYTLKLLLDSDLARSIEREVTPRTGVTPEDIATLVAGRARTTAAEQRFEVAGQSFLPAMRQCVSSELDADRMDYLLRDSYYAGVPYGRFDLEWILENLVPVEQDSAVYLGLDARASFGFEDFLLSRYHMFTSVYFHQIPIGYEVMLKRFFDEGTGELSVPSDVEGYLAWDDAELWHALRRSKSAWARRVVERRAYRMVFEAKGFATDDDGRAQADRVHASLEEAGVHAIVHRVRGELSKYFKWTQNFSSRGSTKASDESPPLFIVDGGQSIPVENYTPLYRRYAEGVHLFRVYAEPERIDEAKRILKGLGTLGSQRPARVS
ncbi:MAG: HD domain-containing protein [Deltaproteobacteria bacterium]|nr:HD domain-containing protein [Deltaproteobacteria bacterium]